MENPSSKEEYTPAEPYNPEDEYTPLEDTLYTADAQDTAPPAPAVREKPGDQQKPASPKPAESQAELPSAPAAPAAPQGYVYPQPPVYPYPVYGVPYPQPPVPGQPPYYPGYLPPAQPYDPRSGAVPPYPAAPYYVYPAPPAPPKAESAPDSPVPEVQKSDSRTEKPVTPTGTKVFLIILTALMIAMIAAFTIYIAAVADKDKKDSANTNTDSSSQSDKDSSGKKPGFDDGGDNGGSGTDPFEFPQGDSVKEFEEEITLIEDKGETQLRDNDNEETVGKPDPKAKSVELAALPADKDDAKYTVQSAYESVCDSVVTVELYEDKITENSSDILGAGTGTIISADGYIITNAHVVGNSKHYIVRIIMNSGESYQAKVIGYDTWTDLAVLKIDAEGLTPVVFGNSEDIVIGQDVIAIGSPGGEKFQNSLTRGVVSAIDREISVNKYVRYIQSDAAISPGNSGGPLCNIYGQVIGINTAKTIAANYEAMTFSIPSATVKETVNELLHYGYVRGRTRIGFSGTEVSAEQQQYYGIPAGLIVASVDPTGALKDTDIREDDIITAIDGTAVSSFQEVYVILSQHKPGDKLTLSVYRVE